MKVNYTTTVKAVIEACGGSLIAGCSDRRLSVITTDSRDLGEENFFVPLVGEKFDGHDYIETLVENNSIVGFLTMREEFQRIARKNGISAVLCDDTLKAFGRISSSHRDEIDPVVIGITGTNGKTTTKELVWALLNKKFGCLKNDKNYNNEVGVPYTLLGLKKEHKAAVIEMGMNHKGELDRLSRMVKPDIALITNIGEGHLEFFGSVDNIAHAKSEVINGMQEGALLLLNRDTECYDILCANAHGSGLIVKSFGLSDQADMRPDEYRLFKNSIEIKHRGETYNIPLYGLHNVYNALGAIIIAEDLGVESNAIREAFVDFRNVEMRSHVIEKDYIVIDDTYNSNPLSSRYALISVSEVFPERRKIAVLSDMKELGDLSGIYHQEVGREVLKQGFNLLCAWGEMAEGIARGAREAGMPEENVLYFLSKDELIDYISINIEKNDVILVKGSRAMKMEEVVDAVIH